MKRTILLFVLIGGMSYLSGCVFFEPPPQPTPLELQSLQTGIYDGVSKRELFNASVTTLQDLGYILDSADFDTGFVTAHNLVQVSDSRFRDTRITLFISEINDDSSRVRINIERRRVVDSDPTREIFNATLDPAIYQTLFNRIRQNIETSYVIS